MQIDASAVQRIDTASLQVLAAFARDRRAGGLAVEWVGVPACLTEAATVLDLTTVLGFATLTPAHRYRHDTRSHPVSRRLLRRELRGARLDGVGAPRSSTSARPIRNASTRSSGWRIRSRAAARRSASRTLRPSRTASRRCSTRCAAGRMQVTQAISNILLKSVDVMRAMLRAVQNNQPIDAQSRGRSAIRSRACHRAEGCRARSCGRGADQCARSCAVADAQPSAAPVAVAPDAADSTTAASPRLRRG